MTQGSICLVAFLELPTTPRYNVWTASAPALGDLVGTVEVSYFDFQNTSMANVGSERKLYLADLAVRPDARHLGVATALLSAVEDFAIRGHYEEIYLHVETYNLAARQLYRKFGYSLLPPTSAVQEFTTQHLQRDTSAYYFLYKPLTPLNIAQDAVLETLGRLNSDSSVVSVS